MYHRLQQSTDCRHCRGGALIKIKHMFKLIALGFISQNITACASSKSIGKKYTDNGRHELAVYYYAHNYAENKSNASAQKGLVNSINYSANNLLNEYEKAESDKDHLNALKIALRYEELMTWAYKTRVSSFDPNAGSDQVAQSWKKAMKQAIQLVDNAATKNQSTEIQVKALRQAMGLDPNNAELNARYLRMKKQLERTIRVSTKCNFELQAHCDRALQALVQRITEVNREKIKITYENSQTEDAHLVLQMNVDEREGAWNRVDHGLAEKDIEKLNAFKEPQLKKDGNKATQKVRAKYEVFKWVNSSTVSMNISIRNLRDKKEQIFGQKKRNNKKSNATYYTWRGDERALSSRVTGHGTNQNPPTHPADMSRALTIAMIDEFSKSIINKLEN